MSCLAFHAMGQIYITDTTALAIAHWKMNEVQSYKVSFTTNSSEEDKVISSEDVNYDLSIKIIDSTKVGYILECIRSNYEVDVENKVDSACYLITQNIPF
jgi:hypothetical protein